MATGPDNDQEFAIRSKAAAIETPDTERFIVPWRMSPRTDLPAGSFKEHDSCSTGECGCGISPDDK